jgi:hypothetical protein
MLSVPIYLHNNLKINVLYTRYTIFNGSSDVSFSLFQIAGMVIHSKTGNYTVQNGHSAVMA